MLRKIAVWDWLGRVPQLFRVFVCVLGAFVVALPSAAMAQGAREYLNTPVDDLIGNIEYIFTRSQSASSAGLDLPNDLAVSRVTAPYLLYSFPIAGRYAGGASVSIPFTRVKAMDGTLETKGFSDPAFAFHMNIRGLKALKRSELAQYVPKTIVSFHMTVNVPIGRYDKNSPINTGAHRFAFTPLVNLNIPRKNGREWYEFYISTRFFTNNNEYQVNKKLTQNPLLMLTAHYSHNIGKKMWASIGGTYDNGGRSFVNGVGQNNYVNGFRPTFAVNRRIGRFGITLRYENTKTSDKQSSRNSLLSIRVATNLFK